MSTWSGQPSIKGSSETVRMMLLTCISVGITFTWGVEMTYCTPYLLSLGLSKGQTSLVWVAGPLSGLIVQPIVGVLADESTSKWGRRRPIIVVGSVLVACSLLALGFTKEIVASFVSPESAPTATIVVAVLSLYATDFSINAVMSCSRSLVVDTLPIHQQQTGASWSSRMGSLGHIIGYAMGAVDLLGLFGPRFGDTQFKQLTVIAALGILLTASVTCWGVTERILLTAPPSLHPHNPYLKAPRQILATLAALPPRIRGICNAVFWAWIGWFPFLVYGSTWVGEIAFRTSPALTTTPSTDALGDMGRIGSTALTIYSTPRPRPVHRHHPPTQVHPPPPRWLARLRLPAFQKPDLLTAWIASQLAFAALMLLTPFAASLRAATLLVALCGVPWSFAQWAPTTFLGIEVNKLSASDDIELRAAGEDGATSGTGELSGVYFGIMNIFTTIPQFIATMLSSVVFSVLEPGTSPELHHGGGTPAGEGPKERGPNAIAVCMFVGAGAAVMSAVTTARLRRL
ncbi:major facilitator superfamily domain-containing protein [Schizothecium vesticola]|uniref:Major facilitator superfamily domain-containing protein n=1 Tax=Schizothecium vesticola TaxID=314040 RepID=A0AA40FAE8_9PEZI|nr:major facilitator superfamily domain-containing protein [Schizothecium vesticola]